MSSLAYLAGVFACAAHERVPKVWLIAGCFFVFCLVISLKVGVANLVAVLSKFDNDVAHEGNVYCSVKLARFNASIHIYRQFFEVRSYPFVFFHTIQVAFLDNNLLLSCERYGAIVICF